MNKTRKKCTRQSIDLQHTRLIRWPTEQLLFILLLLGLVLLWRCDCSATLTRPESIFFIKPANESWQIFQIYPDGTHLNKLFENDQDIVNLSLSVDSLKLLVITSDQDLLFFDLKAGSKTIIKSSVKGRVGAIISKNRSTLLFSLSTGGSNDANHIWIADIKTKKMTQLTHMKGMQHGPIWSHDEKSIFFISGDGSQNEDIWRLDVESGSLNQLMSNNRYNFELACSVDDEIAFSSNRSGNYEIWTMDPFGGNVRQLTHNPAMDSQPSWSPDGEHLVFVSTRDGKPALYIMDRDGNNTRRLTPEGLICRNPVWSR